MTQNLQNEEWQNREWGLADYLLLLKRRKLSIILAFFLVFAVALVYNLSRPDQFASSATFVLSSTEQTNGLGGNRYSYYEIYMDNQTKSIGYFKAILKSSVFLEKVLEKAKTDSLLACFYPMHEQDIFTVVNDGLILTMNDETKLITLSANAFSPIVAYRIAVLAMETFKQRNQEIDAEDARTAVQFIDRQREEAQQRLEMIERSLEEYKRTGSISYVSTDGALVSKLEQIESNLERMETERRLAEANVSSYQEQLKKYIKPSTLPNWNDEQPEAKQLREEMEQLENIRNSILSGSATPGNLADINSKIEVKKDELRLLFLKKAESSLDNTLDESQGLRTMLMEKLVSEQVGVNSFLIKEKFYRQQLEQMRRESPQLLEKTIEVAKLNRSQAVYQNLLNYLVERHEEARIKAATGSGGIRVINPAGMPKRPLSKNMPRSLLLSAFLGLGLGFGLALLRDYIDQTIRNKTDFENFTGLPVIGEIPLDFSEIAKTRQDKLQHADGNNGNGTSHGFHFAKILFNSKPHLEQFSGRAPYPVLSSLEMRTPFAEAFRNLRANMLFSRIDKPIKKILITSAIPAEGKTMVAANLAISFAELKKRVLLIDADLHKPNQHTIFKLRRIPGLTDYFTGQATLQQVIQSAKLPNIFIMPAGTFPPNPTEFLNSQKFIELLEQLETEFDYILVDSPPILSLSDAKTLASKIDNILLVFKASSTDKHYAKESLNSMQHFRQNIMGIVFNGIDLHKDRDYYKYHYYYEKKSAPSKLSGIQYN